MLGFSADSLVGTEVVAAGNEILSGLFVADDGAALCLTPGLHQARIASRPVGLRISEAVLADGDAGHIFSFHDAGAQRATEERLAYLAYHDPLTDLPNRRYLSERLDYEVGRARRYGGHFALHLIDLDDFKSVNDRFGHPEGDKLLETLAARFRQIIRESDVVARLGGDEFAVIQIAVADPEGAAVLAEKLLAAAREAVHLGGYELFPSVTIGVALSSNESQLEDLWRHADAALYQAKRRGKSTFVVVDDALTKTLERESRLVAALAHAIDYQQLYLVYQPQFSINEKAVVGVEALLRWHHPEFGDVSPAVFIPLAERHRLIEPIGTWVLSAICRQAQEWIDAAIPFGRIAFNLSPLQLANFEHFASLVSVVETTGTPWSMLELEVTETAYCNANARAVAMLEKLQRRGLTIAIDDYGTGYSSLLALRKLRANTLKIDRAFIQDWQEPEAAAIIRETISLAHALGMIAVAEGVESVEQLELVENFGCDRTQGFLQGRPVAADQLVHQFFEPGRAQVAGDEVERKGGSARKPQTLEWCPDYETGIVQIDSQHHRLIDLINLLGDATSGEDVTEGDCSKLLYEIAHFVDYHFRCEEAFMSRHHVVDRHVEQHQASHNSAREVVRTSLAELREGQLTLPTLCARLAQWLRSHLCAEDKVLGEQIVAINRGSAPSEAYRQVMLSAALETR